MIGLILLLLHINCAFIRHIKMDLTEADTLEEDSLEHIAQRTDLKMDDNSIIQASVYQI